MPTEDVYSTGHLVLSRFELACVLIVETSLSQICHIFQTLMFLAAAHAARKTYYVPMHRFSMLSETSSMLLTFGLRYFVLRLKRI